MNQKAVMIGAAAGMRCFLAPALLALSSGRGESNKIVSGGLVVLAAGELIADKTTYVGDRTDSAPLAARLVTGAVCGALVSRRNGESLRSGALAGGLAAVATAYACNFFRRNLAAAGIPDLPGALAEDAAAFALASNAVS